MTIDGLLTFIGLMIATYAILSPVNRLRLRLQMPWLLTVGTALAIICVVFLQFYSEFKFIAPSMLDQILSYVSPEKTAFLVVVAWLIGVFLLHIIAIPRASSLGTLKTLSERLHDQGRYLELIELVDPYLGIIECVAEERLRTQRLHNWIKERLRTQRLHNWMRDGKEKSPGPGWNSINLLASLVPARRKAHRAALEIEDLFLQSVGILQLLLQFKPEVAVALLGRKGEKFREFRTRYFRNALNDRTSHFYREIKATDGLPDPFDFERNSGRFLLEGLFGEANIGSIGEIWFPVEDEAQRLIRCDQEYAKLLNGPPPSKDDLWGDPTYNAIRFCEFMLSSAVRQDVQSNMGRLYMSNIVRSLEEAHEIKKDRDNYEDEIQTLGEFLINEAIQFLGLWICDLENLPKDNSHMDPKNLDGLVYLSIPRCVVKDLCGAMRCILRSNRLNGRFITPLLSTYIEVVGELPTHGPVNHLRRMMVNELINGDPNSHCVDDMRAKIRKYFGLLDHVVRDCAPDFKDVLERKTE